MTKLGQHAFVAPGSILALAVIGVEDSVSIGASYGCEHAERVILAAVDDYDAEFGSAGRATAEIEALTS